MVLSTREDAPRRGNNTRGSPWMQSTEMASLETPLPPWDQYCIVPKAPSNETTIFLHLTKGSRHLPRGTLDIPRMPERNLIEGSKTFPGRSQEALPGESRKFPGGSSEVPRNYQDVYASRPLQKALRMFQEASQRLQKLPREIQEIKYPGGSWRFLGNHRK